MDGKQEIKRFSVENKHVFMNTIKKLINFSKYLKIFENSKNVENIDYEIRTVPKILNINFRSGFYG